MGYDFHRFLFLRFHTKLLVSLTIHHYIRYSDDSECVDSRKRLFHSLYINKQRSICIATDQTISCPHCPHIELNQVRDSQSWAKDATGQHSVPRWYNLFLGFVCASSLYPTDSLPTLRTDCEWQGVSQYIIGAFITVESESYRWQYRSHTSLYLFRGTFR